MTWNSESDAISHKLLQINHEQITSCTVPSLIARSRFGPSRAHSACSIRVHFHEVFDFFFFFAIFSAALSTTRSRGRGAKGRACVKQAGQRNRLGGGIGPEPKACGGTVTGTGTGSGTRTGRQLQSKWQFIILCLSGRQVKK